MMIWGLLLLAALIMKLWPETGCARWLHETLIERPLAFLSGIRRTHIIFLIVGFAMMYSFAQIGAPHVGLVAAVDVSAYVDAMITVWTVAALTRARGSWRARAHAAAPSAGRASPPMTMMAIRPSAEPSRSRLEPRRRDGGKARLSRAFS